jgi:competence protein ComEC
MLGAVALSAAGTAFAHAQAGRFILFLPVFMAAGIVTYFGWPTEPTAILAPIMAAILITAGLWLADRPVVQATLLCGACAAVGFASATRATQAQPAWADLPRRAAQISGTIDGIDILPDGRRLTLHAPSIDHAAALARALRIRLRNTDTTPLEAGDTITVRALIRLPSPPAYPGAWDTQRDAYFAGLAGYGFALGPASRITAGRAWHFQAFRGAIAARIVAALPGTTGAIAATLLTGMGTAIPPLDRAAFQASGLAHLLAVAGLHVGIVMGLIYILCRRGLAASEHAALFWPLREIAAIAALLAGAFYLALTGAHVPILRSFAMACLATLALLTGRRALSFRALALAATILMLAAPDLVMGVSFQMSFAAVLALIAGWEALRPHLTSLHGAGFWRRPALHATGLLITSALAGTASLPVAAYHFGTATSYYIPANMLAVPLTAFWVMPLGLAALALMPFGLQSLALIPMGWGIAGILWIARSVAAWPAAIIPVPQMPPAAVLVILAGMILVSLLRTHIRMAGLPVVGAGLALAWLAPAPDIIVSPDAKLIAARRGGGIYVSAAPGTSRFDRATPARVWGIATASALQPTIANAMIGMTAQIRCDSSACSFVSHGQTTVVALGSITACAGTRFGATLGATLIVSHARVYCPSATIVDRLSTAAHGATAIRLTAQGPVIRTDEDERGTRPWVLRQASDASALTRLPPAMTE